MPVPDFRLEPARCALLVNDLQQRTVDPASPAYAPSAVTAVERLQPLLAFCRAHDVPVVLALLPPDRTRMPRPGDERLTAAHSGPASGLGRAPTDLVFEKPLVANGPWPVSGLWQDTPVDAYLRARGRDTVLIAGGTLQYGCDTAVREANNRGYYVAALRDCCFVRPIPDHGWGAVTEADVERVVFSAWAHWFARLLTAADALTELQAQVP
jgi:ureidoacrylate peracid hydrolase